MGNENLNEIIAEFKDGKLTRRGYQTLIREIRQNEDYLSFPQHDELVRLANSEGLKSLTKRQYVQCEECALFRATGVTRE